MNLSTGNIKTRNSRQKKNGTRTSTKVWLVMNLIFFMSAIFVLVTLRISLNEKITRLERESEKISHRTGALDREIENLKIEKEKLCSWRHIRGRIQHLGLALRLPDPYQVQRLVLSSPATVQEKAAVANRVADNRKLRLSQR